MLDLASSDLHCRINIQSDMSHSEFVSFLAHLAGGTSFMNSITTCQLDISVAENDIYDKEKARTGKDRWLYFKYALALDPAAGAAPRDYFIAITDLLKALWTSGMDAVAACDFEDELPGNVRRLKWPLGYTDSLEVCGDTHVVLPIPGGASVLDACVRMLLRYWPAARFEDALTGQKYRSYGAIPFGHARELLVYCDARAEAAWDSVGDVLPCHAMIHLVPSLRSLTVLPDDKSWPMLPAIQSIVTDVVINYA